MLTHSKFMKSAVLAAALLPLSLASFAQSQSDAAAAQKPKVEAILNAPEATKLLPGAVFFGGQSATTQVRNSAGIGFGDGLYLLITLVDTSGYSTGVQAKYQAYLLTEVSLRINGKTLPPGAYGVGFIADNKFNVMDIGAHDLFVVDSIRDAELKRPTPLQILATPTAHEYRLYGGRSYVTISRAD